MFLVIRFECDEPIRLSLRQWQLLSACTFGAYCTGQEFENRPPYTLDGTLMTVSFTSSSEFTDFTRRAFRVIVSRLVAFTVDTVTEKVVTCKALFNHTPFLDVVGTLTDPDGDEDDVSILRVRPNPNLTVNI